MRRTSTTLVPLAAVIEAVYRPGPDLVTRFNGFAAVRVSGDAAPGFSSGQAIAEMERLAGQILPAGMNVQWSGMAFEQKQAGSTATTAFAFGLILVFLILAAQYERWSLPLAIVSAVPFGLFGALVAVWLAGMENDVYFQVGLITLIGLSAKNAILIVEFAQIKYNEGMEPGRAAIEAARLRLRPILMTSLSFILGTLPLVIASGAGANARHSIGTGVMGGMIAATTLALFFVPLFYTLIMRASGRRGTAASTGATTDGYGHGHENSPPQPTTLIWRRLRRESRPSLPGSALSVPAAGRNSGTTAMLHAAMSLVRGPRAPQPRPAAMISTRPISVSAGRLTCGAAFAPPQLPRRQNFSPLKTTAMRCCCPWSRRSQKPTSSSGRWMTSCRWRRRCWRRAAARWRFLNCSLNAEYSLNWRSRNCALSRGRALSALNPPSLPAGLPSDLLTRRPDVRAAAQQLTAAGQQVGVARAARFPRISLTGLLGVASTELSDLTRSGTEQSQVAGGLAGPLFTAGRIKSEIEAAMAEARQAEANYGRTALNALRETEDALLVYATSQEESAALQRRVAAVRACLSYAEMRYEGGYTSYLAVLDALRASVRVYKAFGGSWGLAVPP